MLVIKENILNRLFRKEHIREQKKQKNDAVKRLEEIRSLANGIEDAKGSMKLLMEQHQKIRKAGIAYKINGWATVRFVGDSDCTSRLYPDDMTIELLGFRLSVTDWQKVREKEVFCQNIWGCLSGSDAYRLACAEYAEYLYDQIRQEDRHYRQWLEMYYSVTAGETSSVIIQLKNNTL